MTLSDSDIREILVSAPDATLVVDANGRIVFANTQASVLFGYGASDLVSEPLELLVPDRFRALHERHRAGFGQSPHVRHMESGIALFGRKLDGTEFPADISLSPLKTSNGLMISCAVRDISERKASEVVLRDAKAIAERATAAKSRFLAAASHDLRQPLQSIAIYLGVLNRLVHVKPEKALEVSAKIDKSLDVMSELLDTLLDISKLDAGVITPEKRNFSLQFLLEQLDADNRPAADEKGLELIIDRTSQTVYSDPGLLQRILENFVSNAIRYTEAGHVHVSCSVEGKNLQIEVRDTGIGMPEGTVDTIFEEYLQLDNQVRDRRKGLGLGLSIVKHLSDLLDHALTVSTRLGQGSAFSVAVPLGQSVAVARSTITDAPRSHGKMDPVVLLVDDDPAIIDATSMMLEFEGITTKTALDGSAAIALLKEGLMPDLVISDYRLPGENGIEVIRYARSLKADIPAVLMTGDTSGKIVEQAGEPNCQVLRKPVDTDRLVQLVWSALNPEVQA